MTILNIVSGIVLAAGVTASGTASAATITFTTSHAPQAGPLTFSNGTDSVDVTASRVDANGTRTPGTALIASYGSQNGGLGICTSAADPQDTGGCDDSISLWPLDLSADSHLLDGYGFFLGTRPEMAFIDFGSKVVDLLSITFNYVNDGDRFSLLSDLAPAQGSYTLTPGDFRQTFTLGTPLRGSVFGIGANGLFDNFKVASIGYAEVPAVPLPATGLMLLGALAGAGALKRRKIKAA